MKAVILSCLLGVALMASTSAHQLKLCEKSDTDLETELSCSRQDFSPPTNAAFNNAVLQLGCPDRACAIRNMCEGNDMEGAMAKYFTAEQIKDIHAAATICEIEQAQHSHNQ